MSISSVGSDLSHAWAQLQQRRAHHPAGASGGEAASGTPPGPAAAAPAPKQPTSFATTLSDALTRE